VSKSVILSILCSVLHAFLDNVEVKEEEGTMAGRKTVTSKVKFSANSNDNQATYACEAVHGGLRGANMRVSFLLSVQCKPPLFYSPCEILILFWHSFLREIKIGTTRLIFLAPKAKAA
jgi:hypothetical protein